jgi:hypothetical protein
LTSYDNTRHSTNPTTHLTNQSGQESLPESVPGSLSPKKAEATDPSTIQKLLQEQKHTRDYTRLRRLSPVTFIDDVKCSVLMLLGRDDIRVPIGPNGRAYCELLTKQWGRKGVLNGGDGSNGGNPNVPFNRMVQYDDEGHGLAMDDNVMRSRMMIYLSVLQSWDTGVRGRPTV